MGGGIEGDEGGGWYGEEGSRHGAVEGETARPQRQREGEMTSGHGESLQKPTDSSEWWSAYYVPQQSRWPGALAVEVKTEHFLSNTAVNQDRARYVCSTAKWTRPAGTSKGGLQLSPIAFGSYVFRSSAR